MIDRPDPIQLPEEPPPFRRRAPRDVGPSRWYLVALLILLVFGLALWLTRPDPRPAVPAIPSSAPVSPQAAGEAASETDPGPRTPAPTAVTIAPAVAHNPHLTAPPDGIGGEATWWATFGAGLYAAIRPDLGHEGELAVVCGGQPFHCLTVPITTTCLCLGPGSDRLIDLSLDAFASFAPPSRGVVRITLQVLP